jgi:hypothetical protein
MSKKISELPEYIGVNNPLGFVPISINGVTYKITPELINEVPTTPLLTTASKLITEVKAGQALTKGNAVYVSSATGTNIIVSKASYLSEATSSKTFGLISQNMAINDIGEVTTEGLLSGINTITAIIGDPVFLGASGQLLFGLANKPSAPNHLVSIGFVTRVHAVNGEIFVKIQNGFEVEELHNVAISSVANNDLIAWDNLTSLWKNKSISSILGFTPFQLPSLTNGSILFSNGTTIAQDNANFFIDNVNKRVGFGTNAPTVPFDLRGNQLITFADVLNRDSGAFAFNVTNGTFSRFNLIYDATVLRVNIFGTSAQGLRIEGGASNSITSIGGGGMTISSLGNNFSISAGTFILNTGGNERLRVFSSTGNFCLNTTTDNGGKLQIKVGGALTTDIGLRVRNSTDTGDLLSVNGIGTLTVKSNTFTGQMSFEQIGNATSRILGGPSTENITFGPNNSVNLNAAAVNLNGSIGISANNIGANNATGTLINNTALIQSNTLRNGIIFQTQAWQNNGAGGASTINAVSISPNVNMTLGSTTGTVLLLNPTLNTTGGTNTLRGIYYNPILTNLTGTTHIAIQTVSGNVLFNTTSGSTLIGTATDIASSKVTIESTNQGFLPPRMTNAQRTAIATPAVGLIVYCTDTLEGFYLNKSTGWIYIG